MKKFKIMFIFFYKITWRSLSKRNVFPIINILGLSIGLAVVLLISMFNFNELSFDKSFKESNNIYRVNSIMKALMPGEISPLTSNAFAPALQATIPEVLAAVRIKRESYHIRINSDEESRNFRVFWVDDEFFRLFDTPFIYGSPEDVFARPNTVALSEGEAKRFFGNSNPIGETFLLHDSHPMEVVAVFKNFPENSSFAEFVSIAPLKYSWPNYFYTRVQLNDLTYATFCLLSEKADTALVHTKMRKALSDVTEGRWDDGGLYTLKLQRLDKIHLHSANYYTPVTSYMSSLSDIEKVKMLTLLAVIILLVACVNYMNLSTARAQKRSKEIGVSKTAGAKRHELIIRLTFETAIYTFISFIVAFMLARMQLPIFNNLTGEQLDFKYALQPAFIGMALLIWLVTTLLAASYPAIYMSGFPPITAIRSSFMPMSIHATVRKALTVGQFAVAIVLISWMLVLQAQIRFINNKDLGYNHNNMFGLFVPGSDAIVNDFKAESSVEMVSRESSSLWGRMNSAPLFRDTDDKIGLSVTQVAADPNYIDLMQMKLITGRSLPEQKQGDSIIHILLNRTAVNYLGMTPEEVIGKRVYIGINAPVTEVCGVIENFNFESLHRPVGGLCIHNSPYERKQRIRIRVKEGVKISNHIDTYEQIFKNHFPLNMFEPRYPDLEMPKLYDNDRRTSRIAVVFSILAIFVACLGVFGLTAFMAEQRTKEIGIRKVFGATLWNIVSLFTSSYTKLLGISLVIAIPAAWWIGNQYLQNFAFRISLSWWIFAVAALVTVVLTLLTVCAQAIKAAMKNPVESIKTE